MLSYLIGLGSFVLLSVQKAVSCPPSQRSDPQGPDSAERYQELADAANAHWPMLDLFANATPVEHRVAVTA